MQEKKNKNLKMRRRMIICIVVWQKPTQHLKAVFLRQQQQQKYKEIRHTDGKAYLNINWNMQHT